MKEKEWFIVILKMYCITFCIITFLMTGWSWNAVGGERDKWLRNQPKDQLSTIKASLISTFLYVQYIFWRALTEAPCFVICLPLVAEGCIAWGGEGGTVGVFALDKTKLKVLLSSQSAIVKKSAKIWLGKLQAIIKWISWFKKVWSLNTIEQIGNSKKRWTQHLTFYIFICSLSACHGSDTDSCGDQFTWLRCEYCSPALKRATSRWTVPLQLCEQSDTSHIRWWIPPKCITLYWSLYRLSVNVSDLQKLLCMFHCCCTNILPVDWQDLVT